MTNSLNRALGAAKAAKQDEFYTQYVDRMKLMMMRPGGTTGSEKALGNTFHHKFGKCAWPQRVI